MIRFLLALTGTLLIHSSIYSQTSLKGTMVDNGTRQGIPSVTISLLSGTDSTIVKKQVTDTTGVFMMTGIKEGKYILGAAASGYLAWFKTISIEALQEELVDLGRVMLEPDARLLDGVTVSSDRSVPERQGDKLLIPVSGNRFFRTAANGFDILKKIPGVTVNGDGSLLVGGRVAPVIFVDGKPVPMSAEEVQNYLNTITPEMVSSVELISNPSSRYDGEYKAIIDIRLKRDMTLGWKGSLTGMIQRNAYTYSEQQLLLGYKTMKVAYSARFGNAAGTKLYRYRALQHLSTNDILSTQTLVPTRNNNFNIQLGAEYSINKNHQLELKWRSYLVNRDVRSFNTLRATDSTGTKQVLSSDTYNNSLPNQDNYAANLNYDGKFNQLQLQFQGTLVKIINRQDEDIQTRVTTGNELTDYWKTRLKNDILIRAVQFDLSRAIMKGRISTGGKFAFTTTENDLQYDTLNRRNIFVQDSGRTNSFRYDERISSGYLSFEKQRNNLSYSISLRAEHTFSLANSVTSREITLKKYWTLLPAFSITYTRNDRRFHFSYTRRMTRPNFSQLNPFRFYTSPLNFIVGNPLLLPAKTDAVNISYNYKALSVLMYGGKETDVLARYPEYNDTTHFLQYLGRNLPYNYFGGTEISYTFSPLKWWKLGHTLTVNYKKELTPYHDSEFFIPIVDFTVTGNQVFSLPKGINMDMYYRFQSRGGNGLYIWRPYFTIDLGLQKTWFDGKLNTRLNYYDIFNGFEIRYVFREKQIINNELRHWFATNRVALTISYSFGKSTHKEKSRQGDKSEEAGRAGLQ
ncbi:MAG: outer membrane beta-barrel protein [Chitinophagaceae bacterium]